MIFLQWAHQLSVAWRCMAQQHSLHFKVHLDVSCWTISVWLLDSSWWMLIRYDVYCCIMYFLCNLYSTSFQSTFQATSKICVEIWSSMIVLGDLATWKVELMTSKIIHGSGKWIGCKCTREKQVYVFSNITVLILVGAYGVNCSFMIAAFQRPAFIS